MPVAEQPTPTDETESASVTRSFDVLIVGGGTAGITVAAQLRRKRSELSVGLIEPSEKHYYQPAWTLVGGGTYDAEDTERNEVDLIPRGTTWIRDRAVEVDADAQVVTTDEGSRYGYDALVLCPGIQLDWDQIDGLEEGLGTNGICSNYLYDQAPYTWECIRSHQGGPALFTQPATPVKCGGAPQKIMYLAADYWRKQGLLEQTDVNFCTPGSVVFGVTEFEKTLKKVIDRYGIEVLFGHRLVGLRPEHKEAIFMVKGENGTESERVLPFEMIHVVPPQSGPDFLKESAVADEDGWVTVDRHTLQHDDYPNVFALGDVANLPTAKTGAAVRKQAPVLVHNLLAQYDHEEIRAPEKYNGYSSCPLVTGYGKLVLAEFDYDNNPDPSFPIDTTKERRSMYLLKKYGLPFMYWNMMLKGWA